MIAIDTIVSIAVIANAMAIISYYYELTMYDYHQL